MVLPISGCVLASQPLLFVPFGCFVDSSSASLRLSEHGLTAAEAEQAADAQAEKEKRAQAAKLVAEGCDPLSMKESWGKVVAAPKMK